MLLQVPLFYCGLRAAIMRYLCLLIGVCLLLLSIILIQDILSDTKDGTVYKSDSVVLISDITGKTLGAGFIVKPSGLILTSYTVVTTNLEVVIQLASGSKLKGKVIRVNRRNNLALVEVDAEDLPWLKLGDSGTVRNIDKVIAIGYPLNRKDSFFEARVYGIEKAEGLR